MESRPCNPPCRLPNANFVGVNLALIATTRIDARQLASSIWPKTRRPIQASLIITSATQSSIWRRVTTVAP